MPISGVFFIKDHNNASSLKIVIYGIGLAQSLMEFASSNLVHHNQVS